MSDPTLSIEPVGESKPVLSVLPLSVEKIVLGYEHDECGHKALRWAEEVAVFFNAQLIITHSVPTPSSAVDIDYGKLKEDILLEARRSATDDIRRHLHHPDRTITQFVTFEDPTRLLLRTASQMNADLIIVGSHGRTGIDQFLFGSVSESLAFQSPCPVLVCGPECRSPWAHKRSIILASNHSDTNIRAAEYAKALAERTGSSLIAMDTLSSRPAGEAHDRLWKEDHARELMRIALDEPAGETGKIRYCIQYGDPAEEVLAMACREDAALVVLGSGERTAGSDHLSWRPMGQVLRSAECPVLIVSAISK